MKVGQGTYGNRQSGQTFSYLVPDNARKGQKFRVEAYNEKAQRVIQTMWTLTADPVAEHGGKGYGEETIERQKNRVDAETGQTGVSLRTVLDNNTLALPGGQKYRDIAQKRGLSESRTKALWSLDSNIKDHQNRGIDTSGRIKARDRVLGLKPKQNNTAATKRLLGG